MKITLETTKVVENIKAPKSDPKDIKPPSSYVELEKLAKTSGAPLANAINVTAATVGFNLNLLAKSYIPSAKYLSAIRATHINSIG